MNLFISNTSSFAQFTSRLNKEQDYSLLVIESLRSFNHSSYELNNPIMTHLRITQRHYMTKSENEKNLAFEAKQNSVGILALPSISCVALGKSFLFESPFPHL